jgi:hypothetical protein
MQNTKFTATSMAINNNIICNGNNKTSKFLAHRPNTATTTTRRSPPSTCNTNQKINVLPRPTTQASEFRLRPTTINGYRGNSQKQKTDKS